jgi:diguanylate cyclase (GGDEF)-like protein/PAS domain S-box-containing protein
MEQTRSRTQDREKLILALESMPVEVVISDSDGRIEYVNPEFTAVTGYEAKEVIGKGIDYFYAGKQPAAFFDQMRETIKAGKQWTGEICCCRKSGEEYWELTAVSPVVGPSGEILFFVSVKRDITTEHQRHEEITHLALFDQLTELPNRTLFLDRLRQALNISQRKKQRFALVVYDLDGFKPINDTHGHLAGDFALKTFAARLADGVRRMDTAARLGGDEFAAILLDVNADEEVEKKLERLGKTLSSPMDWNGTTLSVGTSWGTAYFPDDGESGEDLLREADLRMYRTKIDHHKVR